MALDLTKAKCGGRCRCTPCPHAVIEDKRTGRWYITMGHAGFNSPANNRWGYVSKENAVKAYLKYAGK